MPEHGDQVIVCNSGPLIALAGIHCLELLRDIYKTVTVPEAVYQEVTCSSGLAGAQSIMACSWIHRTVVKTLPDRFLTNELGKGEAEVIALALKRQAHKVLIDERKARRIAELYYGLNVTGTGGILLRAKRTGLIDSVRLLMQRMRNNGYYLSDRLMERIAKEAGESF